MNGLLLCPTNSACYKRPPRRNKRWFMLDDFTAWAGRKFRFPGAPIEDHDSVLEVLDAGLLSSGCVIDLVNPTMRVA
jgi:hypothetical protein